MGNAPNWLASARTAFIIVSVGLFALLLLIFSYYLTQFSKQDPIELESSVFIEYSNLQVLFLGLFLGYMLAMALSNLYIYITSNNHLFLLYAGHVCALAIALGAMHGFTSRYLLPDNIWLQELAIPVFASISLIFIVSLSIKLLDLKTNSPFFFKVLHVIWYVLLALLGLCFLLPYELIIQVVLGLVVVCSSCVFIAGVPLAIRGNIVARYFCVAWAMLLLSGLYVLTGSFGVYESNVSANHLLMVSSIIETLLLAISININQQLLQEKRTYDSTRKNEQEVIEAKDELISLQEKDRTDLEYSLGERNLELEITLRELNEKNSELEKLSAIDPLTGLMNRRYFDKRILAECRRSKREKSYLGIAMLDIDHFKKINDNYGHLCGDHCLKEFAKTLKEAILRPSDIICRYGGEEFVLILPNTEEHGLVSLLEKVRESVARKKIMFEGHELTMTVSIGCCSRIVVSDDETSKLVAIADKQVYKAKDSGRNCIMVASE